jgi:AcrR family transcriptional regulator
MDCTLSRIDVNERNLMARRTKSTDPRSQRLRAAVRDAALQLVSIQDVDTFTLNDLLQAAGVSRQGFYEHFTGRDDAILHAITDDFAELLHTLEAGTDVPALLRALTQFVDDRRSVYTHIRGGALFDEAVDQWRQLLQPTIRELIYGRNDEPDPERDATVSFVVGGIIELIRVWLRSNQPVTVAHETELLWAQVRRSLRPQGKCHEP